LEKGNDLDKTDLNILIVDDDQSIARTFSRILQKKGYQTDTASTGREAIQKTASKCFDVALIDVCLPDMNGMELVNKLSDHGRKMVKIVITGFPTMTTENAHPDAYLLKPVNPQELLSVINQKTR